MKRIMGSPGDSLVKEDQEGWVADVLVRRQ